MKTPSHFYRLHKIIPDENQYRFYTLRVIPSLFNEWALVREWGRIGRSGTIRFDVFKHEQDALNREQEILQAKVKKGYNIT
jgi:predicted DNA-binding WGR domain protein